MTTLHRRGLFRAGAALAALGGAGALTACASPTVESYRDGRPALDLRRYLNGRLRAHGMFVDRSGVVLRRFVVEMTGTWKGDEGVLDEDFVYDDGEKQKRVWRLTHLGEGRWRGRADDVIGDALGTTAGHAFRWQYTMRLPWRGSTIDVNLDDWMFLVDERVLLNRATMSKFGVTLGEIQLSFEKL